MRFIDADSFQWPGFACEVSTEAFLDPHLYGPDPSAPCLTDGGVRSFTQESDWYAFAALAFRSLACVHPFGGVLAEVPSFAARARRGRSVLDERVVLPAPIREAVRLLGRDLLSAFTRVFEGGARGRFPLELIASYASQIVRCGCGLDLPASMLPCPRCQPSLRAGAPPGATSLRSATLFETGGPVVALSAMGSTIQAVAIEDGIPVLYTLGGRGLSREPLTDAAHRAGFEVSLSEGSVAWVPIGRAEGGFRDRVAAAAPFVTERVQGRASFAASRTGLFRIARGTLLRSTREGEAICETPSASVMSEQTRLFASSGMVLGSERFFAGRRYFAIARDRRIDLAVEPLSGGEALVDEALVASASTFAVLRVTLLGGRRFVRTACLDREGAPLGSGMLPAERRLADDAISRGLLSSTTHLVATDQGLVREDLTGRAAAVHFAATAPFVARDTLLAASERGLVAAQFRTVRALALTPERP